MGFGFLILTALGLGGGNAGGPSVSPNPPSSSSMRRAASSMLGDFSGSGFMVAGTGGVEMGEARAGGVIFGAEETGVARGVGAGDAAGDGVKSTRGRRAFPFAAVPAPLDFGGGAGEADLV